MNGLSDPPTRLLGRLAAVAALGCALAAPAVAGEAPGKTALAEQRGKFTPPNVIQNKFFLKSNRFEISPVAGYVPNNSFVNSYVGGVLLNYHFTEEIGAEGAILYSPNTGDVKGLTTTLLDIASQGSEGGEAVNFQQPLDRLQLGANFGARWAPVYGKINLVGEGVLNFDVYGTAGLGVVIITRDLGTVASCYPNSCDNPVELLGQAAPTDTYVSFINPGFGMDFFLSQSVALKLDARSILYVGPEGDYGDPDAELKDELHTVFITTAGVSIFVPKMKARMYNF
jgi:outer membrane beta-barrel protein